jgi:hypothetical protein
MTQEEKILEKVRKLMSTAESHAELGQLEVAETYRSQAVAMLNRYQLDAALLERKSKVKEDVILKTLTCEGTLQKRWWTLLHVVTMEGGCRSVGRQIDWVRPKRTEVDVIGFPSDVEAAELLWTSLMLQAQAELRRAMPSCPPGLNRLTFQKNFLDAFNGTIMRRLQKERADAVASVEKEDGTGSLLPVLRDRKARVDEFVDARFGRLRKGSRTGTGTSAGRSEGAAAGSRASMGEVRLPAAPRGIGSGS